MCTLPLDLVNKIFSYLPILDTSRIRLNQGIVSVDKMNKIIQKYSYYFKTWDGESDDAIRAIAIGWVYNDLTYFLNNKIPVQTRLDKSYREFLSRMTMTNIYTYSDLQHFETRFSNVSRLIRVHASYMTDDEISDFEKYCNQVYNLYSD